MKLYCEGHIFNKGWAISRIWSEAECRSLPYPQADELRPVRFIGSRERAMALVERWNRRFATH